MNRRSQRAAWSTTSTFDRRSETSTAVSIELFSRMASSASGATATLSTLVPAACACHWKTTCCRPSLRVTSRDSIGCPVASRSSTDTFRPAKPADCTVALIDTVSPNATTGAASTSVTARSTGGSVDPTGTAMTGARGCPPAASAARRTASSGSMPTVERPSVTSTIAARPRPEASSIAISTADPSAVSKVSCLDAPGGAGACAAGGGGESRTRLTRRATS